MADGMRHQGQSGYRHFLSISDRPSSPRRHDEDSSTARTSRRTPPRHSPVIRASRRRTAIPAWRPVLRPNRSASARRTSLSTTRQKSCLSRLTGAHQPRQRPQVRILPAISAQPRDDDALLVMSAHVAHKAWSKTLSASPQATSRPENTNAATTATATSNPAMLAAHAPRNISPPKSRRLCALLQRIHANPGYSRARGKMHQKAYPVWLLRCEDWLCEGKDRNAIPAAIAAQPGSNCRAQPLAGMAATDIQSTRGSRPSRPAAILLTSVE